MSNLSYHAVCVLLFLSFNWHQCVYTLRTMRGEKRAQKATASIDSQHVTYIHKSWIFRDHECRLWHKLFFMSALLSHTLLPSHPLLLPCLSNHCFTITSDVNHSRHCCELIYVFQFLSCSFSFFIFVYPCQLPPSSHSHTNFVHVV